MVYIVLLKTESFHILSVVYHKVYFLLFASQQLFLFFAFLIQSHHHKLCHTYEKISISSFHQSNVLCHLCHFPTKKYINAAILVLFFLLKLKVLFVCDLLQVHYCLLPKNAPSNWLSYVLLLYLEDFAPLQHQMFPYNAQFQFVLYLLLLPATLFYLLHV